MAMGLISDDVFLEEVARLSKITEIRKGRGPKQETPQIVRKIAGETALIEGRTAAIAAELGLSKSSVDAYKHGATSTASYNQPNTELKGHLDEVKDEITSSAKSRLRAALSEITNEKLEKAKLRDISGVARDMSSIIKNMEPTDKSVGPEVQFVFFAPQVRKIEQFDIIDVGD